MTKILVAGVGNILRGDDGFGIEVVKRLIAGHRLPPDVTALEFGIAGISFVQELLDGYDALIILDVIDRAGLPGTLSIIEPQLPEIDQLNRAALGHYLADLHQVEPFRALILAKALQALPKKVILIGCQPAQCDELAIGLSPPVAAAIPEALQAVISLIEELRDHPPV
jgi:hydrogenase maturation protease